MFESPFYVDYPLTLGVISVALTLILIFLLIQFNKRGRFYELFFFLHCLWFFEAQYSEKLRAKSVQLLFLFFIFLLGFCGLFYLSVGIGLIKNKDSRTTWGMMKESYRILIEKHEPFKRDLSKAQEQLRIIQDLQTKFVKKDEDPVSKEEHEEIISEFFRKRGLAR